jgi:type III pantothenate kinase
MLKTLLAIDVGNTSIECGVFKGDNLLTNWKLTSEVNRSSDECWQTVSFFCQQAGISTDDLDSMALASVVPAHSYSFLGMAVERITENPLDISARSCPFLKIKYENPGQVGADRLCNAYAGFQKYKGPLIIVDFGTAITFDIVDADGAYLGGVIAPGPVTSARSLNQKTSRLPLVSLDFPSAIIGQTTIHSIQSGITWGIVDLVDGLIGRISDEFDVQPKVISTGGYAHVYAPQSKTFRQVEEHLVLNGIQLIFEKSDEK